jgi:hypothetical protein
VDFVGQDPERKTQRMDKKIGFVRRKKVSGRGRRR